MLTNNLNINAEKIDWIAKHQAQTNLKIEGLMQRSNGNQPHTDTQEPMTEFGFPLKTVEEILACNEKLRDDDKAKRDFVS